MEKSNLQVVLLNKYISAKLKLANIVNQKKVMRLKHTRSRYLTTILHLQLWLSYLCSCMLTRPPNAIWKLCRSSKFWEFDVPNNGDNFFKENFRMSRRSFDKLCWMLSSMARKNTKFRNAIPLDKRVAIGVYALGSSAEYRTVANLFGVGRSTVCEIVIELCYEIWHFMKRQYLNAYSLTAEKLKENIRGFEMLGFPQCFGAIDGCHIEVKPHASDAVDYHNYKGWYSTILLALVDYRYRFMYVNVGSPGRCNDSAIYENSRLKLEHDNLTLREISRTISEVEVPALIIGDSAFRFSQRVMKPYPFSLSANSRERKFNYALSASRRVVENAFGHLKARFRRIGRGIENAIENAPLIIKACCTLHNFLNEENDKIRTRWLLAQASYEGEAGRQQPVTTDVIGDSSPDAMRIRNSIADFLCENSITGQEDDTVC